MMQLEHFTLADIAEASFLSLLTWGDEMEISNSKLQAFIYEAMVRYYFRSSKLSFKITENSKMQGFLLASAMDDAVTHLPWFRKGLKDFTQAEQDIAKGYIEYLHYNGEKVRKYARASDVLLCLFLSRKSGVGGHLLYNAELAAQKNGAAQVHLWADATCDYAYYLKRGYVQNTCFVNNVLPKLGEQQTWIYSKKLAL